ncbi:hypothetical protein [Leeuwenhoekiella marinoflava]|uniref:Uncharacterized protein n=2 Tax=Leeuwenhoekiella marinoflava TaxID=988 RepID=A0A4V1KSD3_9FLAO|nr:hypothetical protein [Leeuwenhoekiella marinoflava]RXG29950.1 hypothetical protein DSL99_2006 [Leeuwenhoekiella marinoflava]SHF25431.1 hypothetical protein SAMN02745246_02031 [Leeuwenhoekiella marinoflava DSM 3653]
MKKVYLVLIVIASLFQSCKNDDCGECFTPPQGFIFELVNTETGENIFTNDTYDPEDIAIVNTINDTEREFQFIAENQIDLIQISKVGWETEIVNLEVKVGEDTVFNLYVNAERTTDDCCSFTKYNEIEIRNAEFELDSQTGVYKILVDLN